MPAEASDFLSRDEIFGGLPARRAQTLLYAIENRTAHLVSRSRSALAAYESERTMAERERSFLDAISAGREPSVRPSVTDLERYASDWAHLVPSDPSLRAVLARLAGERHRFTRASAPRLAAALGLNDPDVRDAFVRIRGQPIDSIFASSLTARERLRWTRAGLAERLETMPPSWTAFALTLTHTVSAGILALPIALATIGTVGAVALIVGLGVVNLITIAALVEAITRTGTMRYGFGYLGRLVGDYLGRPGTLGMSAAVGARAVLVLALCFLGFGAALGGVTGLSAGLWAAALLLVVVAILGRGSLDATVASALVVGAVNVVLITVISLTALGLAGPDQLIIPSLPTGGGSGGGLGAASLGLAIAVVLGTYGGHTSVANAAKLVLRRDPSGRSLLMGNLAAMAVTIVLYVLAVVGIVGAVGREVLVGYRGTSLELVSDRLGPLIGVLGVIYAVLAMGLGAIHHSHALSNLVVERLPSPTALRASDGRLARFLVSPGGISAIKAAPVILVAVAVEWLIVLGVGSFTAVLGLSGAVIVPILGGVFPMLLVFASRRRGEYVPGRVLELVGHPLVVIAVTAVSLGVVAFHGLVIYESVAARSLALAVAAAVIVVTLLAIRSGAFRSRAVVELRVEDGSPGRGRFAVTAAGRPATVDVTIAERSTSHSVAAAMGDVGHMVDVQSLEFVLPARLAPELKVWLHRVSADRESSGLPATVALDGTGRIGLDAAGQALVTLDGHETRLTIRPLSGPGRA